MIKYGITLKGVGEPHTFVDTINSPQALQAGELVFCRGERYRVEKVVPWFFGPDEHMALVEKEGT